MAKYNTCVLCGENKHERMFSSHRNEELHNDFGYCKDCLSDKVKLDDKDSVISMLRLMNVPFIETVWESSLEHEEFTKYLQMAFYQRSKYKDFLSGDIGGSPTVAKEVGNDMIAKWGKMEDENDYQILESIYDSYVEIKAPSSQYEQDRYAMCAKLKFAIDQLFQKGEIKEIKSVREAYSKELSELGLNVSAAEDEEISLGERIGKFEKHDPVESVLDKDDQLKDVDNVKEYVHKYFLYPVKNMFGQATEEEIMTMNDQDVADG